MSTQICVNIGSGNGLVPDGTKLLPEPVLTDHQWSPATFILGQHYNDAIMGAIASQITSLMIVYSIVYSDADQRKYQSSASLAFVRGIHQGPVNSPHKWPVTRKMFPFDDIIMISQAMTQPSATKIRLKITCLKFHSNLPGSNEFVIISSIRT